MNNRPPRHSTRLPQLALMAVAALAMASSFLCRPVAAGVLWVDTAYESISIPLESPAIGLTRAKMYLAEGNIERASAALRKIVTKYPTASEAHQLLAKIYRDQGKVELAALHDALARRG